MLQASGLGAQLRYQALLLVRTPRGVFAGVLFPAVLIVLRSGSGGPRAEPDLVAALSCLGVLSNAYLTHAVALVTARESGVLRRWYLSPLPASYYLGARVMATVALSAVSTVVLLATAWLVSGFHPSVTGLRGLLGVTSAGAIAWSALGTAASAAVPTVESAQPMLALTFYPVLLLSGGLGADPQQPAWLSGSMAWLPARPLVEAAQGALGTSGTGSATQVWLDLAVLAGWTLGGVLVSWRWLSWMPRQDGRGSGAGSSLTPVIR